MVQNNAVTPLTLLGLVPRASRSLSLSLGPQLGVRGAPPLLALLVPAVVGVLAALASVGLYTSEELYGGW